MALWHGADSYWEPVSLPDAGGTSGSVLSETHHRMSAAGEGGGGLDSRSLGIPPRSARDVLGGGGGGGVARALAKTVTGGWEGRCRASAGGYTTVRGQSGAVRSMCNGTDWHTELTRGGPSGRDAVEGKGPQRRPQRWLGRRLEEVAKAVGGSYCRLQMPLRPALGVRGTVAGHRLGGLEGGGYLPPPPFQCIPALCPPLPPPRAVARPRGRSATRPKGMGPGARTPPEQSTEEGVCACGRRMRSATPRPSRGLKVLPPIPAPPPRN